MSQPAAPPPRQLSARTLQVFGLALILASALFWAFTDRESVLLVGAGVTLSTLGWLQRAFATVQEHLPQYDQPPLQAPDDIGEIRPPPPAPRDAE